MIERLTDLPAGVIGLRAGGTLTATDFEQVVTPMVDDAMRSGGRMRCLIEIEPGFEGATPPAAADDVRLGLRAFGSFDGVAVVTGPGWVASAARWAAVFVPFPLRVFAPGERAAAADWLAALPAGAGITLALDEPTGVVTAEVTQALRVEDFEALAAAIDPWMREKGELPGLVLHLRGFPRWASVGSLVRHVRFVVGHQGKIGRLAVVTDTPVAGPLATVAGHVVHPQVRAFGYADLVAAQAWAATPAAAGERPA
jgi:SpoIIAA-like